MFVHLLDGTYELFRSYYGAPSSTNSAGIEVGATRGLMRSLVALLREPDVTHIGIAFDTVIESFRNKLFDGYKTGEGIDPLLFAQFPLAERACEALGICTWRMIEFEADDAVATAAVRAAKDARVKQVRICTPDKDLAQCVEGDRIVTVDRMRDRVYDEDGVKEKFGVSPASIPDYLALVGDTADGIPGVPRWGEKSASTVLARYEHLEKIPDDAAAWDIKVRGAGALAAELASHRTEALLYRTLATVRTDVPLAESLDDLEWRGADRAALTALCEELGEKSLPTRVTRYRD
ncbi:MAG: flap endonuclease [Sandaracinaceae bacterium]|jgi:5'-3' exonuclease|nr:flap endonuclease [Sandaracinaceae bacterium]